MNCHSRRLKVVRQHFRRFRCSISRLVREFVPLNSNSKLVTWKINTGDAVLCTAWLQVEARTSSTSSSWLNVTRDPHNLSPKQGMGNIWYNTRRQVFVAGFKFKFPLRVASEKKTRWGVFSLSRSQEEGGVLRKICQFRAHFCFLRVIYLYPVAVIVLTGRFNVGPKDTGP